MGAPPLQTAELAGTLAAVLAVNGAAIGGAVLSGPPSPARDHWLAMLKTLAAPDARFIRVPVNISEDRLLGGIDLAATLEAQKLIASRGLLIESHDGFVELAMAERQSPSVISALSEALDSGQLRIEREGITDTAPANFCLIAIDEATPDDPPLDARLRDRLGGSWTLTRDGNDGYACAYDEADCAAARQRVAAVTVSDTHYAALMAIAEALGLTSPRAVLQSLQIARALAALEARAAVGEAELQTAALLGLVLRVPGALEALQQPPPESPAEPTPPADNKAPDKRDDSESGKPNQAADDLPDSIAEAGAAILPLQLLASLAAQAARVKKQRQSGRSGARIRAQHRGRPVGVYAGVPDGRARLDILATLKAAAPLQTLRQGARRSRGLAVRRDDLRLRRYQQKTKTTTIFTVDASGSAAVQRLAETKGAIELLLAECYVRRDQVALIAFRREAAQLLLPATRSLVRAKRALAALPGGGGTPLAAGLQAALKEAQASEKRGETPLIVLMTDARANITLAGERDPVVADEHALAIAGEIAACGYQVLSIDTGRRPGRRSQQLAASLDARYLPLPFADAASVSDAVRSAAS